MPARKLQRGRTEYGIEDEGGNLLVEPSVMTKEAARLLAQRLASRHDGSVYVIRVGKDRDGARIVVDRDEVKPPGRAAKSEAQLKREGDEVLARSPTRSHATRNMTSEAMVALMIALMIGRHVRSGWSGLDDGEILEWEPFGAGLTDVLVKDVASGKLTWYASHSLTPIDGLGPLPSRAEVRKIREEETAASLKKIAERWANEPRVQEFGADQGSIAVPRTVHHSGRS